MTDGGHIDALSPHLNVQKNQKMSSDEDGPRSSSPLALAFWPHAPSLTATPTRACVYVRVCVHRAAPGRRAALAGAQQP
jgi:hypothetical protein